MYYNLFEGLKMYSNEPVYCTVYSVHCTPNKLHTCNIPYVHNISCKHNTLKYLIFTNTDNIS